jgi:hypothetical protein
MKQRKHVKTFMFSDEFFEDTLFEGNLGQLIELAMSDDKVLEIKGFNGVLRVDITLDELENMTSRIRSSEASGSKLGSYKKPTSRR